MTTLNTYDATVLNTIQNKEDIMLIENYHNQSVRLAIIANFISFLYKQEQIHNYNPNTQEAHTYFLLLQELNQCMSANRMLPNLYDSRYMHTNMINIQHLDEASLVRLITIKNQELHYYQSELERRHPVSYYQRFKNFLYNAKHRKHILHHHCHCCHY